jgi:hypothetical protein
MEIREHVRTHEEITDSLTLEKLHNVQQTGY